METSPTTQTHNILVTVDVQNDFVNGSLAVANGEQVIAPLNELATAVRASLGRVAFTRDWHPVTTPHFDTWPVHCVADTTGAELHPQLEVRAEDTIMNKGMGQTDGYSGTEAVASDGTTIETMVTAAQAEKVRVFVGGLATDYCVKATAIAIAERFASDPTVSVYAIREAMRAVNIQPTDEAEAIKAIATAGVHITNLTDALVMINHDRVER